jgi:hypothetical protein
MFINLGVATFIPFETKFEKNVFSSNISNIPEFILNKETEHRKRERKRSIEKKERKKSSKSLSFENREFNILRREHFLNFSV